MEMTSTALCNVCGQEHPVADTVTAHHRPQEGPCSSHDEVVEPRGWWLADGEALHELHPRSYFIPPRPRRDSLEPGELVKLEFVYGPHADREGVGHAERMWVEVLDGHHGCLRNQPARLTELNIGDHVHFEPQNVITIDYSDEELGYAQEQWPAADQRIFDEDVAPDLVVRAGDDWFLLTEPAGPRAVVEHINRFTELFPGLIVPFQAGDGMWQRASGECGSAVYKRVEPDETLIASLKDMAGRAVKPER